jgi:hypothetical protein
MSNDQGPLSSRRACPAVNIGGQLGAARDFRSGVWDGERFEPEDDGFPAGAVTGASPWPRTVRSLDTRTTPGPDAAGILSQRPSGR